MDTCDRCGQPLRIGDFPFCPHGVGVGAVVPDDVPGGFVVENGFDGPRKFYTKSAHREALAAEGCEIRAKWAGPLDRHLRRWDVPSQYTLDAATALVGRRSRASSPAPTSTDTLPDGTVLTGSRGEAFTYPVTRVVERDAC